MYKGRGVNKHICIAIALKYPSKFDGVTYTVMPSHIKAIYTRNKKTYIAFLFNKKDVGSHY